MLGLLGGGGGGRHHPDQDGQAGVPLREAARRLRRQRRQPGLQRRPHDAGLPIHSEKRRAHHGGQLPLQRRRRDMRRRKIVRARRHHRGLQERRRQLRASASGGGRRPAGVRRHRRRRAPLPVVFQRRIHWGMRNCPQPRCRSGRVRQGRRQQLLAGEELLGRRLGRGWIHQDQARRQQRRPLRDSHAGVLPLQVVSSRRSHDQ